MKYSNWFVFLLLTFSPIHWAFGQQNSWNLVIADISNNAKLVDIKENSIGEIYAAAYAQQTNGNKFFSLVYKIDTTGKITDSLRISSDEKSVVVASLHLIDVEYFILTGSFFDMDTRLNVGFFKTVYNSDFDVISYHTYDIQPELGMNFCFTKQLNNGDLMFYGSIINYNRFTPMVYLFDSTLNLLKWNLPDPENYSTYVDVRQLNDTSYWALKIGPWEYEKLDTTFSRQGKYPIPGGAMIGNMSCKWTNDSTFYLLGKSMDPSPLHNLAVVKQFHPFDTTGHLFWRWNPTDTVDYPSAWKGIDLKHPDTLFAGGTHNLSVYNPYYAHQPSWFVVLQLDSLLNLRWERFYGGDYYYVMSNLIATQDGGCLIGGWRFDYHNSIYDQTDLVLFKLNNEGLITGLQKPNAVQVREAIIFPNPVRDQMHIRLALQHPEALLILYDQNGKRVLEQQLINTESTVKITHLSPGLYLYTLTSKTGLNESGKFIKQ
ncbi:MAG: T9SS type A sorting domain-containing protein [Lentimicrobium sp.]|nr:T9SS type A sorting domain-containing protein [Lentimicrobium sp.]